MTHIAVFAPAPVATPRGATVSAALFLKALNALADVARVQRERSAATVRAREAHALRREATAIAQFDPSFAADLRCAADRHIG